MSADEYPDVTARLNLLTQLAADLGYLHPYHFGRWPVSPTATGTYSNGGAFTTVIVSLPGGQGGDEPPDMGVLARV